MRGTGRCHGSFGELAQGVVNGQPFLISLPVDRYSEATFYRTGGSGVTGSHKKKKAITACELLLSKFHIQTGGWLSLQSNIPEGKGMASSTADIVASLRAVAASFALPLTPEIISEIAVSIEPTDGMMYDTLCAYNHKQGKLIEQFGSIRNYVVVGIDVGGVIDTIAFNQSPIHYEKEELALMQDAFEYIKIGIKEHHPVSLYKGTTISVSINERILPKPYFKELRQIAVTYNGGLVTAHSGTVIGILTNVKQQVPVIATDIQKQTNIKPFVVNVSG